LEERKGLYKGLRAYAIFSMILTTLLVIFVLLNAGSVARMAQVLFLIKTQALEPVTASQLIDGSSAGLVSSLEDPYSTYLKPEVFESLNQNLQGTYGGVGLVITQEEDNRLVVVSAFKGTPAYRAGILSGDWIVRIDGQDTSKLTLEEAANLMQGEPGTKVRLSIWREGEGSIRDYEIEREIINVPSVEGQMLDHDSGIAYISITQFAKQTGVDFKKTLQELEAEGMKGIVLDLRNNGGGLLGTALEVASHIVPKGPIVHIVDKNRTQTYEAPGGNLNIPLAVLINKGSASASEIVSGAIKDTKVGVLVGETTFGKGLVQTVFPLNGGAAVKLTTAKYLTPNKKDINVTGIEPNVKVEVPAELRQEIMLTSPNVEKDPQLQKAIEILQQQIQ
jgi:carboxyl-terminal processing protease